MVTQDQPWIGNWSPKIGDPTVMGWVTVAAYFLAAWLSYRAYRAAHEDVEPHPGVRRLWALLTGALVLLGINKQLDLQTAFTETGRWLAHSQGWYDDRRPVQAVFIALFCLLGGGASGATAGS